MVKSGQFIFLSWFFKKESVFGGLKKFIQKNRSAIGFSSAETKDGVSKIHDLSGAIGFGVTSVLVVEFGASLEGSDKLLVGVSEVLLGDTSQMQVVLSQPNLRSNGEGSTYESGESVRSKTGTSGQSTTEGKGQLSEATLLGGVVKDDGGLDGIHNGVAPDSELNISAVSSERIDVNFQSDVSTLLGTEGSHSSNGSRRSNRTTEIDGSRELSVGRKVGTRSVDSVEISINGVIQLKVDNVNVRFSFN
mmetsp:Transcript_43539/g.60438  ORF Transcript_43539/g.60438 Transcript_43539/m.60438 type:complete len:248 (-) Transcript_43539:912-1655(-)